VLGSKSGHDAGYPEGVLVVFLSLFRKMVGKYRNQSMIYSFQIPSNSSIINHPTLCSFDIGSVVK
jgi:hypothetical protein